MEDSLFQRQADIETFADAVDAWLAARDGVILANRAALAQLQAEHNQSFITHTLSFAVVALTEDGRECENPTLT